MEHWGISGSERLDGRPWQYVEFAKVDRLRLQRQGLSVGSLEDAAQDEQRGRGRQAHEEVRQKHLAIPLRGRNDDREERKNSKS